MTCMAVDVATEGSNHRAGAAETGRARSRPGRLPPDGLIKKLNQAVRRPETHGGVPVLPLLLDLLAEAEHRTQDTQWIPDANERLRGRADRRGGGTPGSRTGTGLGDHGVATLCDHRGDLCLYCHHG